MRFLSLVVLAGLLFLSFAPGTSAQAEKVMIFGGVGHKTYLGCLNCSRYDADSVENTYGEHGSRYSSTSIWNQFSEFGSEFSNESACSEYATDPPVIVDQYGNYYGRLTLNRYAPDLGAGGQLLGWLSAVCHGG